MASFLIIAAVVGAIAAIEPAATQRWNGTGWYQTEATAEDYRIISGPFTSKLLCLEAISKDTDTSTFRCYDMVVKPRWEI